MLILDYVDSVARGKLRLTAEEKSAVFRLLTDHQEARDFAESAWRDEQFIAGAFDFPIDQSRNEDLAKRILGKVAPGAATPKEQPESQSSDDSNVVELRPAAASPVNYGWMAAAASIVLLFGAGIAGSHFYTDLLIERNRFEARLDGLTEIASNRSEALQLVKAEAENWRGAAEQARYDGDQAAMDLADAQFAISKLRFEQETLQVRYESNLREEMTTRVQSEAELQQAEQKREQLLARIQELGDEVTSKQQALASLEQGRSAADRNSGLQIAGLEAELAKKGWIGQVVGYHRVFASQPREFLVERTAAETDAIKDMLAPAVARDTEIPDLSSLGITFAGARLLGAADGKPVAQLIYLDPNDQPLALCIMPLEKESKEPTSKQANELNLVDWRDGKRGFLLIGNADAELMTEAMKKVRPYYEL